MRALCLIAVVVCASAIADAQPKAAAKKKPEPETYYVDLGASKYVSLGGTVRRVSVGSPIADVDAFPPDQILITGKRLGHTSVTVWKDGRVDVLPITVGVPRDAIASLLATAIPSLRDLTVDGAGTAVVLSGQVGDVADVERAEKIVRGFLPAGTNNTESAPTIVNLLRVANDQQVQLEVAFAEVSRTALKQIGVNLWSRNFGQKNWTGGLLSPQTAIGNIDPTNPGAVATELGRASADGTPLVVPPISGAFSAIFGIGNNYEFPFAAALSILANRGYARTLAEPTLVALSGTKTSFLAGGEFPMPLPLALGQVAVEFKKFGVQLEFVPTVVDDTIQLTVDMVVSDLDFSLGIKLANVTVPGLTTRHSAATVRLKDGQSFAIAGLLSDKVRSNADKVPLLGDIPILGMLFRSTRYQRDETELIVVVTARRVRALNQRPELPAEFEHSDPSDLELFTFGSNESKSSDRPAPALAPTTSNAPRGPSGAVGFSR
jgi:pilus assembly protein CpaC